MNIIPPDYKFCPFCGRVLTTRTEEQKQRRYCADCRWTYYPRTAASVSAVICDGNRALLVKRRHDPFKGTWMFPSGFVDFGEHPVDSLAREIGEETGLTLKKAKLLGVFQSEDDYRELGHLVFFYRALVSGDKIKTDEHENEDISWFDIEEPPEIRWKLHKHFMCELKKGQFAEQP